MSGQNVAFVLSLLAPFLARLRLGGRLAGGLAALVLFGILTRWEPSVLRAVAMAGLTLLAAAMGRPASSLRILSLAVTGLVLVDPLLVNSLGFLLSLRRGVVVAGLAGAAVALAPAVAVLRPGAIDDRGVVPGARLWRAGGASVLVVDDLRASPEALLSALHLADVRRLDVLVVTRPGPAASADLTALLRRFPPRLVLAPSGHRLAGRVVVPPAGSEVAAGGLVVDVEEVSPRLVVQVSSSPGP